MHNCILITGASRGIGKSIALQLAKKQFNLILWGRSPDDLRITKKACEQFGVKVKLAFVNIAEEDSINTTGAKSLERIDKLMGVVLNAGIGENDTLESITPQNFRKILDVNLFGSFLTLKLTIDLLKKTSFSHIITIGSDCSEFGFKDRLAYCSSKWGLYGLCESLRDEVRDQKVKITHLLSSRVDTYFRNHQPGDRPFALHPDHIGMIIGFIFSVPDILEIREMRISSINSSYGR